jgi:hypothetical protein
VLPTVKGTNSGVIQSSPALLDKIPITA